MDACRQGNGWRENISPRPCARSEPRSDNAVAMANHFRPCAKSKPTSKGFIARWTKVGADLAKGSLGDTNVYFAKAKPIAKAKPKASVAPQGIAKLSKAQLVDIVQRFMAEAE